MTRVLVLSDLWLPFPGGAERLVFNIARHLQRAGEDVVAVTGYENAQRFDGVEVVAMPIGDGEGDPGWGVVAKMIEGLQPRVIVTHHRYAYLFADELEATRIPVVQIVLNGRRLPFAKLAVYISGHVRREAGSQRHRQDLTMIPPAFDDVRAKSHGDAIGFVKPYPHKGAGMVYAIAESMPDRRFVILRGEWRNLEEVRLDLPNVEHMDPVDDMRDFYARCRLILMPSRSEDAGTVAQEATVNGLPCISSNVQGLAETNARGIRLDPYDVHAWLAAIVALDDPRSYARIVKEQQAHLSSYDHESRLDELAEAIRGLG